MKNFLKDLLVEDDGKPAAPAKPAAKVPTIQAPPRTATVSTYRPPAPVVVEHPEVRDTLEKALEQAAQPALSALKKSMIKLEKAVPDYEARLSAALALLDGSANPRQVVVDIQECLTALQVQEKKALDGANAARQARVGGIETQLAKNEKRLQELAAEAERLQAEQGTLSQNKDQAAAEIDETLSAITSTAEQIRNELTALKASVEQKGV
jgi:chromosome segregation ATPase